MTTPSAWPYPRWIAHRGAGTLAPENTLAALRMGARHGWRMAEVDVQLSADGVAFLLHDATLDRTTSGHGLAAAWPWAELSRLDAGRWHSPAHAGEPLPSLAAVAAWCRTSGQRINLEIKPSPGLEHATGDGVAAQAARLWAGAAMPPLLSSFSAVALAAARQAAPALPRALLLDHWCADTVAGAQALDCRALVGEVRLWNAARVAAARRAGLRCLSYTVNQRDDAQRLSALGLDGMISDRIDHFQPDDPPNPPDPA